MKSVFAWCLLGTGFGALLAVACTAFESSVVTDDGREAGATDSGGVAPDGHGSAIVDAGDADDGAHPDGGTCFACTRLVFVTTEGYGGNDMGGIVGADGRCTNEAQLSELTKGRQFHAWLSEPNSAAGDRIPHGSGRYERTDGVLVANGWSELASGTLRAPINVDRFGKLVVEIAPVWTGTFPDGGRSGKDCDGWMLSGNDQALGTTGRTSEKSPAWTTSGTMGCNSGARLVCVER